MPTLSRLFVALAGSVTAAASSAAVYVDIPIAGARDHAFEGNTLYVTSDTRLHRYDLKGCALLPPIDLGTRLRGIDISADGRWVAIADGTVIDDKVHIYLIDRHGDDVPVKIEYPAAFYESGSYMVAWTRNNQLAISGSFAGSGWVPLRHYDPQTGVFDSVHGVRQDTMLAGSGDGTLLALGESNISRGPAYLWDPVTAQRVAGADLYWFVYEVAADDHGTRLVVPTYNGAYVLKRNGRDANLMQVGRIGQYATWGPLSVVIPPGGTQFITADWDWKGVDAGVKIYDATTLALQKRIDNYPFPNSGNWALVPGRLTLSRDTRWLAATTRTGVRLYDLADEPVDRWHEPGEPPITPSCGAPHAFDLSPAPVETRQFDADGWEVGRRPGNIPRGRFGDPVNPIE